MSLRDYRRKRDFTATAEPAPKPAPAQGARRGKPGIFVVQKHAARRLHYDLRLELDGVLLSWAVTRGPSLVPAEKRLAVHVEDHPCDYHDFEGTIPLGQYGAGTVIVWDRGTWHPRGDPRRGLAKGHLDFTLKGEKLTGGWHLVRLKGKPREKRENWLLIKAEDDDARDADAPDILTERPLSVKTGRDLAEVAGRKPGPRARKARAEPASLAGARRGSLPDFLPPMLASLVSATPSDERWLHEIKFDGYRLQARIDAGKVRLFTRSGLDWSDRFGQDLPRALAALPLQQAILDGELVVEEGNRGSDFSALQADLSAGRSDRMRFYAFDLMHLDGQDLTGAPLTDRKRLLAGLLAGAGDPLRFSEHFQDQGDIVLRHACRLGLEGVISKRADSPYRSGRGRAWVKSKCSARQEFVVAGYVPSTVSPHAIGSLVLGVYEGGGLTHVGRVGTGFTQRVAEDLMTRLQAIEAPEPAFAHPLDRTAARGMRPVRPDLVAEVDFRAWTADGQLRHAAFRGLREDKDPREVTREAQPPATASDRPGAAARRRVPLTHPDRVYWPDAGVSKAGLADYYAEVWTQIAPHVVGRPLALLRCPDGIDGPKFFQKHVWKGQGKAILSQRDPASPGEAPLIAISDLDGLLSLVQSAALEIHPWGSTLRDWERPDRITLDLDPGEGVTWPQIVAAAREVRQRLTDAGLAAYVKTSGGKGLHVMAPLLPKARWPEVKSFCRGLAQAMAADQPDRYVATITLAMRRGRILVDYLRNQRGATAVAAYSTRARPGATVSAPLTWEELGPETTPDRFTVETLPVRIQALREDPWAGFADAARVLKP